MSRAPAKHTRSRPSTLGKFGDRDGGLCSGHALLRVISILRRRRNLGPAQADTGPRAEFRSKSSAGMSEAATKQALDTSGNSARRCACVRAVSRQGRSRGPSGLPRKLKKGVATKVSRTGSCVGEVHVLNLVDQEIYGLVSPGSIILGLRRMRQGNCKIEASLGNIRRVLSKIF